MSNRSKSINGTSTFIANHDSTSTEVVMFASQKCPPGVGLDSACQLPFGFVFTPLPVTKESSDNNNDEKHFAEETSGARNLTTDNSILPEICLTCLSYRSKYSQYSIHTGKWACKICGQDQNQLVSMKLSSNSSDDCISPQHQLQFLPLESTTYTCRQPLVSVGLDLQKNDDSTLRYDTTIVDRTGISLVFDQNLPAIEAHCIIQTFRETAKELLMKYKLDYNAELLLHVSLIIFGKNVSLFQLGVCSNTAASADVVRTHDGLLLPSNHDRIQKRSYYITISSSSTIGTIESQLEPLVTCITAHYGAIPPLEDQELDAGLQLNNNPIKNDDIALNFLHNTPETPAADIRMVNSSSTTNMGKKSRMQMLKERKEARQKKEQTTNCGESVENMVESPWMLAREQRKNHFQTTSSSATRIKQNSNVGPNYRCTGEAIECALEVVSVAPQETIGTMSSTSSAQTPSVIRTGRILLFTNGCPNYGSGTCCVDPIDLNDVIAYNTVDIHKMVQASEFFESIAKNASECGIGIDVFCSGTSDLAIPAYQSLVEPSSGYVLSVDSFWSNQYQFQSNFRQVVVNTYVSLAQYGDPSSSTDQSSSECNNGNKQKLCKTEEGKDTFIDKDETEWMDGVLIDIRMSSFVSPTHLIGPGDLVDTVVTGTLPNERTSYEMAYALVNNPQNAVSGRLQLGESVSERNENKKNELEGEDEETGGLLGGKKVSSQHKKIPVKKKKITIDINEFMLESSLTRIRLGRFDSKATFSVMVRLNELYDHRHDQHAFFQITVRYVNRIGTEMLSRISTYRLPVSKDCTEFVQSLHPKVVPVLLAKEAVYRSMYGGDGPRVANREKSMDTDVGFSDKLAYDAQRDLDETIFRISRSYRLLCLENGTRSLHMSDEEKGMDVAKIAPFGSSIDTAFPSELSEALRSLYHMRRGPLLSPGPFQSPDDKAELRSLFLRLPLEDCYDMMAPKIWSCSVPRNSSDASSGVPYMEDVPPETLILWNNRVIAADSFHSLFVWSGMDVATQTYDGLRNYLKHFLLERAKKRFPMPNFHLLNETDSMSRRFTALLAPSHGDPVEHQLASIGTLLQLSEKEQAKLRSKFRFYDPSSDPSFRNWFWDITSAVVDREVGESLCE